MKRKKLLSLLLAVMLCISALTLPAAQRVKAAVAVSPDCTKVLLVGNSYTYYNGYGEILSKLGGLTGKNLLVVRATKGDSDSKQLLKSELEYKAWYNGSELQSGSGKKLSEISAMDFGDINRSNQWNAVFSQNNSDSSIASGDIAMFNFFADKIPTPKAFVIQDTYVSYSVSNAKRKEHDKAAEQCGCSVLNTRDIFAAYPSVFGVSDWKTDLTYRDDSYHPTPRAAYLFALATYAKLFSADKFSSVSGDYANFIPLYNADGGKASEFISDKYKTKSTSANAMTVPKAAASAMQYLVRSHFLDCVGETVLTETVIVPAYPGFNGSVNTMNLYSGELYSTPIPAPQTVILSGYTYTCNGKAVCPGVTVYDNTGNLIPAGNYTVSYQSNTYAGTAKATVTFRGKYYTGSLSAAFTILPKGTKITSKKKLKKGFTVKWRKPSDKITGYQIQYATNKQFTKAKKVTVKSSKTLSKTVSRLSRKKVYYIRIRTYRKVGGKNYWSAWSGIKKVKTK